MKFYIPFIVLFFGIYGCSGSKRSRAVSTIMLNDSEMTVTFLGKLKADTVTVLISSLIEGCELVHLEYTEEALFIPDITHVTDNYIGIIQDENYGGSYKLFSRSGKFLCSVGSVGQGPGEYLYPNDVIIDEKNELIYLAPLFGDKIFVYNMSGRFLRNIEFPQPFIGPTIFLSDDILTIVYIQRIQQDKSMVAQINLHTGQIFNEFTTQIPQLDKRGFGSFRNMQDIADIMHGSFDTDTIYHFNISDNLISPVFTISDNAYEKRNKRHNQLNKDLVLSAIAEPNKGLILTDLKNKSASWVKVKNDFFGNLDTPLSIFIYRNGYFVHNIQPEQLMEDIKQRLTNSNCTEKDRQILIKTLSTLKEGENNVVFIGKLKK